MNKLKILLENTDAITLEGKDIDKVFFGDITELIIALNNRVGQPKDKLNSSKEKMCKNFELSINKPHEIVHRELGMDETTVYDRLTLYNDIVALELFYDDYTEWIGVPYSEENDSYKVNHDVRYNEVADTLDIRVWEGRR